MFFQKGRVGMADPYGNAAHPGAKHEDTAMEHGMPMDDLKIMPAKQVNQIVNKCDVIVSRFRKAVDAAAQRKQGSLVDPRILVKDQIVILKFLPVPMKSNALRQLFRTPCFQGTANDQYLSLAHWLVLRYFRSQWQCRSHPGTRHRKEIGWDLACFSIWRTDNPAKKP